MEWTDEMEHQLIKTAKTCHRGWVGTITGMDYWTGLLDSPKLQNTRHSVQNRS